MADQHKHIFETKQTKVLLHDARGNTNGYDILTERFCTVEGCTYRETTGMDRTVL